MKNAIQKYIPIAEYFFRLRFCLCVLFCFAVGYVAVEATVLKNFLNPQAACIRLIPENPVLHLINVVN